MLIKYKKKIKVSFRIFLAIVIAACVYVPFQYSLEGEYLLIFPIILFSIYSWLYIAKYSLEITETRIILTSFLINKTIDLSKVVELGMYHEALSVKTRGSKIKVTTDLENHKDAIALIIENLKGRKDDIKIKGEKAQLMEYFNK
jgi:hypothetical protein